MITVCVATIPPRAEMLCTALESVARQQLQPTAIIVEYDHLRLGAAETKNRALAKVTTPLVAFLDDDDSLFPEHLSKLYSCMKENDADLVYSVPHIPQAPGYINDPARHYFVPFDPDVLRKESHIQTNVLVKTDMVRKGGGFWMPEGSCYDDWGMTLGVLNSGGKIIHLPEITFTWNHWAGNTSGRSDRW